MADGAEAVVPPEAQFLVDGLAKLAAGGERHSFASAISSHWRLRLWGLAEVEPLLNELDARCAEPAEVMTALAAAYARQTGQPQAHFWIDHTPGHVAYVSTLFENFPAARLVHLVRDPRAVVASVLPLDWGPSSARAGARWWLRRVGVGVLAEITWPDRVKRIHYEDVVRDPEATLREVGEFVGLSLPAAPLSGANSSSLPAYTRSQHALVGKPLDRERICAWQRTLSPAQVAIIESEVGDTLALLGYRPSLSAPLSASRVSVGEVLGSAVLSIRKRLRNRRRVLQGLQQSARHSDDAR
jgi:hypothetical protein